MRTHQYQMGIWAAVAAAVLVAPQLASAQYVVRRVYTTPAVVAYPAPAVVTYAPAVPVVTYPVYTQPVVVASPVVRTYTRCYTPAVSVRVGRSYGYGYGCREYRPARCYSGRGWSASLHIDRGHGHRSFDLNLRRYRH